MKPKATMIHLLVSMKVWKYRCIDTSYTFISMEKDGVQNESFQHNLICIHTGVQNAIVLS